MSGRPFLCFSCMFSPVYAGWACRAPTAPSPRCRLHRTPGCETSQTSGRAAACEPEERITAESGWALWGQRIDVSSKTRTYPSSGPPFIRSKTWAGFRSCLNLRRNFTPWLSPLLEFTRTRRGLAQDPEVAFQKPNGKDWKWKKNLIKKQTKNNYTLNWRVWKISELDASRNDRLVKNLAFLSVSVCLLRLDWQHSSVWTLLLKKT